MSRTLRSAVELVWEKSAAEGADLLVAIAVAARGNARHDGWTFASTEQLARDARVTRWTVMRSIAVLEQLSELEVRRRVGKKGRHEYRIKGDVLSARGDILHQHEAAAVVANSHSERIQNRPRVTQRQPGPTRFVDTVSSPRLQNVTARDLSTPSTEPSRALKCGASETACSAAANAKPMRGG